MNMEDRTKLLIVKAHGREKYAIPILKLGRSALNGKRYIVSVTQS